MMSAAPLSFGDWWSGSMLSDVDVVIRVPRPAGEGGEDGALQEHKRLELHAGRHTRHTCGRSRVPTMLAGAAAA
jgi:hypothetical protein